MFNVFMHIIHVCSEVLCIPSINGMNEQIALMECLRIIDVTMLDYNVISLSLCIRQNSDLLCRSENVLGFKR